LKAELCEQFFRLLFNRFNIANNNVGITATL